MLPIFFANPAGWWALLGIPAVLLIHLLQRRAKTLPVSTLFLLDAIDRLSARGTRWDRLRHSLPLWLQLLAVVLLAWLLAEPRRPGERAFLPVVVVLDSSASMQAFRAEASEALARELERLTPRFGETVYTLLESHDLGARLYRGSSLAELRQALESWQPVSGTHTPENALRLGRSLAGSEGTLLLLTDRLPAAPLPYGAFLIAAGSPIDNVGFVGQRIERTDPGDQGPVWQASVRNYSREPQERDWFLAAGPQRSPARRLSLAPGETRTLSGPFPPGAEAVSIHLKADRFPLDDRIHLVVPRPKPLLAVQRVAEEARPLLADLAATLENLRLETGPAPELEPELEPDLVFATYNPLAPSPLPAQGLVFLSQRSAPREFLRGSIAAANHPFVENLNWQGLIARQTPGIPLREHDLALLWQGERPLVVLRQDPAGGQALLFNFDVLQSNAPRLPAFVVLVHRFVESLRETKVAEHSANFELRQALAVAHETGEGAPPLVLATAGGEVVVPLHQAGLLRAPAEPGFFEVRQGGATRLVGAANFADAREADFADATTYADLAEAPKEIVQRLSVEDASWRAFALALLALALGTWAAVAREGRQARNGGGDD